MENLIQTLVYLFTVKPKKLMLQICGECEYSTGDENIYVQYIYTERLMDKMCNWKMGFDLHKKLNGYTGIFLFVCLNSK